MTVKATRIEEETQPRIVDLPFSEQEFERRLDGIRSGMRAKGLDAFITFTPENLYYVNAHDTPGYYWYQALVVTQDRPPMTVVRLIESSATLWMGWSRLAVTYGDRDDPIAATVWLLGELGVINETVGLEADAWFISPRRYALLTQAIEEAGGTAVDASGLIEAMRITKSAEELAYMRAAARVVERGMAAAIASSHVGVSENDVAAATTAELIRAGGEYAGLPPFIVSGPRTSICHATWSGRTYQQGDLLNYELPGVVKRYCVALFRCGTVGPPDPEISRRAAVTREALEAVIEAIKPGVTLHDVNAVNRRVFEKHGLGHLHRHRTGYSLGVNYPPDWGEGHIISIWENDHRTLEPGMTFHLGVGMFDLGHNTVETSESVCVTETGCEVLTNFPRDLFVA